MKRTIRTVTTLALMGSAALAGFIFASQPNHCQAVVLKDIAQHQQFTTAIAQQVSPDFLTTLTRGR